MVSVDLLEKWNLSEEGNSVLELFIGSACFDYLHRLLLVDVEEVALLHGRCLSPLLVQFVDLLLGKILHLILCYVAVLTDQVIHLGVIFRFCLLHLLFYEVFFIKRWRFLTDNTCRE